MEELDLESVLELARGHDADALAELYRRYARRVFGLCRYLLGSTETAEDATSEVFLKLQRSIDSYDGSVPFPSWLLRVASNHCIDALRRTRRERQVIAATPGNLLQAVPSLWRSAMDTNIVVYSQCAECEEPGLFLDPGRCARCLSGYEPIESDDKDDVRGLRFACAGKLELLP